MRIKRHLRLPEEGEEGDGEGKGRGGKRRESNEHRGRVCVSLESPGLIGISAGENAGKDGFVGSVGGGGIVRFTPHVISREVAASISMPELDPSLDTSGVAAADGESNTKHPIGKNKNIHTAAPLPGTTSLRTADDEDEAGPPPSDITKSLAAVPQDVTRGGGYPPRHRAYVNTAFDVSTTSSLRSSAMVGKSAPAAGGYAGGSTSASFAVLEDDTQLISKANTMDSEDFAAVISGSTMYRVPAQPIRPTPFHSSGGGLLYPMATSVPAYCRYQAPAGSHIYGSNPAVNKECSNAFGITSQVPSNPIVMFGATPKRETPHAVLRQGVAEFTTFRQQQQREVGGKNGVEIVQRREENVRPATLEVNKAAISGDESSSYPGEYAS